MAVSEFLFTPNDIFRGVRHLLRNTNPKGVFGIVILLCAIFFLWLTSTLQLQNIAFLLFIFSMFYWNWDSRISILLALMCLVCIPILLVFKSKFPLVQNGAEVVAVWAYYFLAIGVVKQIWEYWREPADSRFEIVDSSGEPKPKTKPDPEPNTKPIRRVRRRKMGL